MRPRHSLTALASACCLGALGLGSAAENADRVDTMWAPYVSIGYAPSVRRVNNADFSDKGAGSLALGSSMAQIFPGNVGYTIGVDVFDTYGKSDGNQQSVNGISVKTNDLGLKIDAGPIYDFTPELSLALLPYIGVAWAHFVYSGGSASSSDNGVALVYGGKLALDYAFNRAFKLGIYGGIEGTSTRLKAKNTSDKYNATGYGPVAGLKFGWQF